MKSHSEQQKISPMSRAPRHGVLLMHKGHLGGGQTLKRDRKNHGIWKILGN